MTRWAGLPQRPTVLVEAPEELSRSPEGTSQRVDLTRTCRRVHSGPSPEGLNRPDHALDPDLNPIQPGCPRAELLGTFPRWVRRRVLTRLTPGHLPSAAAISAAHRGTEVPQSGLWDSHRTRTAQDRGCQASQTQRVPVGSTSDGILSILAPHACSGILWGGNFPGDVI